jgi:phosphoribosylglycinamide formyltransferase-1
MYGRRVHEAVVAAGAPASAITIHLVDEEYDHGAVIAVREVPLQPGETAESLEARVTALEPEVFVETLQQLASGRLALP